MTNQYQQVGNGISHLGQVAQQIALGLAQQRYQQAQAQQMMQLRLREQAMQEQVAQQRGRLMGQQGQQAESMTGFNNARASQVDNAERSKGQLKDALWQAGMVQAGQNQGVDMGPRGDIAISRVMEAMGGLPASGFNPEHMAQLLQMNSPRAQQMMATGTKMNASVSPGATLYDLMNQQPLFSSPRTLGEGQVLRPNVEGSQGLPKTFAPDNPNDMLKILQGITGSFANVRNAGLDPFGKPSNPNNPAYKAADEGLPVIMGEIMNRLTNGSNARIGLQAPAPQLQPAPTQMVTPKTKADLANQISQQNPTWTREQVINAVKQQFGE